MNPETNLTNTLAPLVLRLTLAVVFLYHGLNKVIGPDGYWGATWASHFWEQMDTPPADLYARINSAKADLPEERKRAAETVIGLVYSRTKQMVPDALQHNAIQLAVAWGELLGGVALLVGFLPRLAALGLIIIQLGAIYSVTWTRGFSFAAGGGFEYNLVILGVCLSLLLTGGGKCGVSHWLNARAQKAKERAAAKAQQPTPAGVG